ncbi:hypothetical protein CCP3SC1AL1_2220011 [Gammaproteobacteria bacterium]
MEQFLTRKIGVLNAKVLYLLYVSVYNFITKSGYRYNHVL